MPNLMDMTPESIAEQLETNIVAQQNDAFRQRQPEGGAGRWVFTRAIDNEGSAFLAACMQAVATYDDFNDDNDPHGTHEMGFMEVDGKRVWWRIDLYNLDYNEATPERASLQHTRRVLTIMTPSDY